MEREPISSNTSTIRIIDIAQLANVSVGTVDRVIHHRGRVSESNREKVEAVLREVDYQPNIAARSLASKKQYRIVAIIPEYAEGEYWEALSNGIDKAIAEISTYNIKVDKLFFSQYLNQSFDKIVSELFQNQVDAVLIATLFTESVIQLSAELDHLEIPYVYVDSPVPHQKQLAYFGTNSYDAGWIAAKTLAEKIPATSDVLMAKILHDGSNDSNQGINREKGFCDYLTKHLFQGNLHRVELRINDQSYNDRILDRVFTQHTSIRGAVSFNSTCYILGEYIKARQLQTITLVGYDLIHRNCDLLSSSVIDTLFGQRPEWQGYSGIKALSDYFIWNRIPQKINFMPIDILIKENIKYYLNNNL